MEAKKEKKRKDLIFPPFLEQMMFVTLSTWSGLQ